MNDEAKKILAGTLVLILILSGFAYLMTVSATGRSEPRATIEDLLSQIAVRKDDPEVVIASADSPFYALVATPVSLYYKGNGEMFVCPLLVASSMEPSSAVDHFLTMYRRTNLTVIGDVGDLVFSQKETFSGDLKSVSLQVARSFWVRTKGALLVHPSQIGYNLALMAIPLASYLNMPVIVTDSMDSAVRNMLSTLGVRFTLVFGPLGGYGEVMRFPVGRHDSVIYTSYETADFTLRICREIIESRLSGDISYLAVANPLDIHDNEVISERGYYFDGIISDSTSGAYPGAAPSSPDGPIHRFYIPEGWDYVLLKIDIKMDVSEATGVSGYTIPEMKASRNADDSGERIYCYLGLDGDEDGTINAESPDDVLYFFGGSPGYEYIRENPHDPTSTPIWAHFYTEIPMIMHEGVMDIQLLARLPTDYGSDGIEGTGDGDGEAPYTVEITVQRIRPLKGSYGGLITEIPVYPLMKAISSMAPYLTAYRKGLLLAKPQYLLHGPGYIGCSGCGVPAGNEEALDEANERAVEVKKDINQVLGMLADIDLHPLDYDYPPSADILMGDFDPEAEQKILALAEYYQDRFYSEGKGFQLGIVADPNMVPQFYYNTSQGDPTEGFGMPSDNFYMDIDADPNDPPYEIVSENSAPYEMKNPYDPDLEVGAGRVDGWDAQDVSALIARSAFYFDIIRNYRGPANDGARYGTEWMSAVYTTLGTIPPVEVASLDLQKFEAMASAAGFYTGPPGQEDYNQFSRRQYTYEKYESANMIFFCAHGFYYWYVPTAQEGLDPVQDPVFKPTYGGGAYDVAHVKDMTFGPSVIFGSSCVTGRIDGLYPKNALSLAFLHSGMNAYVGATRLSWGTILPVPDPNSDTTFGDYLALLFYANFFGYIYDKSNDQIVENNLEDLSTGMALMDAKNKYIATKGTDGGGPHDDTINEFILHGDPAFNPYEPNHQG